MAYHPLVNRTGDIFNICPICEDCLWYITTLARENDSQSQCPLRRVSYPEKDIREVATSAQQACWQYSRRRQILALMLNDEEVRMRAFFSVVTERKVDEHAALLRLTDGGSCFDLKHAFGVWIENTQPISTRIRAFRDNIETHQKSLFHISTTHPDLSNTLHTTPDVAIHFNIEGIYFWVIPTII